MAIANTVTGWVNSDGLLVKDPQLEIQLGLGGTFADGIGHQHVTEFDIDYTKVALGLTDTNVYILDYNVYLPDTAIVDRIDFVTGTLWATDTNINFGLVKRSDFTTIHAATGLVSALVLAARDAAGETTTILPGGTYAGSKMGLQAGIGFDCVVSTHWVGAAPTAGNGKLKIFWRG